jgi:hypothetical protein
MAPTTIPTQVSRSETTRRNLAVLPFEQHHG